MNLLTIARRMIAFVLTLLVIGIICHLPTVDAQDVKYCIDLTTGEIKVVKAGMPCPYPMAEM
jgi:hypothetical protein